MELTGTIKAIFQEERKSDKFVVREFVVTTEPDSPYPQHVILQLSNAKCDLIIGKKPGDKVICSINIKGREWNGPNGIKYFNTIECWQIRMYDAE